MDETISADELFAQICATYRERLVRVAGAKIAAGLYSLRGFEEDLVQDALIQLLVELRGPNAARVREVFAVAPMTVLRRKLSHAICAHMQLKRNVVVSLFDELDDRTLADPYGFVDDAVAWLDSYRIVADAPGLCRSALALYLIDDLPLDRVASILGLSLNGVRDRIRRGLHDLRAVYGVDVAGRRSAEAAAKRVALVAAYRASLASGAPLAINEVARRFRRTQRDVLADLAAAGVCVAPAAPLKVPAAVDALRALAVAEAWGLGAELPTVGALTARFGFSKTCIRRALALMAEAGWIRLPGRAGCRAVVVSLSLYASAPAVNR
jgi:DNA-directed RNA polymerase specialized sigma24 family protein